MRDFLKMTLAAICGFLIVNVFLSVIGLAFLGAVASLGRSTPSIPKSGVLTLDLSKFSLAEQSQETNPLAAINAQGITDVLGIWDAVSAINYAAEDPAVKYIYIKADGTMNSVYQLEELRAALKDFKDNSGKAVVAYTESPTTGSYYLSSVADKVYMTSHIGATNQLFGVSSQMIFLGDLLKKMGVNVQLIRHGKFKSAGEMFIRGNSSAENREQNQRMVDSIWEGLAEEIAQSRNISTAQLNAVIDGLKLDSPQSFVDCGLVDELFTREQLKDKLADLALVDDFESLGLIPFVDYVKARAMISLASKEIAVVYVDGELVDMRAANQVEGNQFASIIAKVRADSTVKAVVLRVNSPGGSVLAAEKIKDEIEKTKAVKPVVASYGGYAASGGYWISCDSDKIYSDKTTLTGSIGVFSLIPDFSGVADKFDVGVETVSSSKHGDIFSLMRPFDRAETAYFQSTIEQVYDRFTSIVSEGRGLSVADVDNLGQGRVWSGADAVQNKLVDEIGTLEDAIHYAAILAGDDNLSNWAIGAYPKPKTALESIMELMGNNMTEQDVIMAMVKKSSKPMIMARMDRDITIR